MDNRINPQNAAFLLQLYDEYLRDENSVDPQWKSFFSTLPGDSSIDLNIERPASWAASKTEIIASDRGDSASVSNETRLPAHGFDARQSILDSLRAIAMIRAYRIRGHLKAKLDPLDLSEKDPHPELEPSYYGSVRRIGTGRFLLITLLGLKKLPSARLWRHWRKHTAAQ